MLDKPPTTRGFYNGKAVIVNDGDELTSRPGFRTEAAWLRMLKDEKPEPEAKVASKGKALKAEKDEK